MNLAELFSRVGEELGLQANLTVLILTMALLLARNQKLGISRLRELLTQSTENHDTTRGPFRSVNACVAVAKLVRGASCAN
jgi:hypothetical protein